MDSTGFPVPSKGPLVGWLEIAVDGLVLGGPPDLLPTQDCLRPGCHSQEVRFSYPDAPQKYVN